MDYKCKKCGSYVVVFKLLSAHQNKKVFLCPKCQVRFEEYFSENDEVKTYIVDFKNKTIEEVK